MVIPQLARGMRALALAVASLALLLTATLPQPAAAALQEGQTWMTPFMPYDTDGTGHCLEWAVWRTAPATWRLDYSQPLHSFSQTFSTSGPASSAIIDDRCDGYICPLGSSVTAELYRLQTDGNDILVSSFTLPC